MVGNSPEVHQRSEWAELVHEGFGLDAAMVLEARQVAQSQIEKFEKLLNKDNEAIAEAANAAFLSWGEKLEALSDHPDQVLAYLSSVFDRLTEYVQSGMDTRTMVRLMINEFPELENYYSLMKKRAWGERLGQLVITYIE